jgi:retron-type reverse transcriptase
VVDADLKGYFDSIPHDRLKQRLAAHISDGRLLALLDGWIEQDVVQELKRWTSSPEVFRQVRELRLQPILPGTVEIGRMDSCVA